MFNILIAARSFGFAGKAGMHALQALPGVRVEKPEHRNAFNEKEMCEWIIGRDAVIVGTDAMTARVISSADRLKCISKHGIGVDNIDLGAATAAGIMVTNLPGVNDCTVADMTFGLILSLVREICKANQRVAEHNMKKFLAQDIGGKILGVIGTGRIGREVVKRARAFDMQIIACDLYPDQIVANEMGFCYVSLEDVISSSDIITIHVPLTAETHGLINSTQFDRMKDTAFIVNTSRAGIIDEQALVQALYKKKITGAALDVFDHSLLENEELNHLENLILTPHIAAYTKETLEAMDLAVVEEYHRIINNTLPLNIVNREVLDRSG